MVLKIFKFIGIILILIIVSAIFWFKFILNEFDEFKNATFFEHRKHISTDGPYIINQKDSIHFINVIQAGNNFEVISKKIQATKFSNKFIVSAYNYDEPVKYSFEVELMDSLEIPKSTLETKGEIFSISDIEGNFYAFQKLLKSAKIIDEKFNWIYNKNHLVLIGDMVDRGLNVTQCLWLIYKLEHQAKEQGGSVHFIIGNHETMEISGRVHHVRSKYKSLANELALDYSKDLLGKNSELGRWLRTKNAVEKINDNLFAHGGISPKIVSLDISLDSINNTIRKYYGQDEETFSHDKIAKILYSTEGPLWYRKNTRKPSKNIKVEMEELISHFKVKRLIIGHSATSDIFGDHNNTLYNIDVHFPNTDNDTKIGMGLLTFLP